MEEQETRYILTKEEMMKLSVFQGDAIWRLRRAILLDVAFSPMFISFMWAMIWLTEIYVKDTTPVRFLVIFYWIFLALSSSIYVLFRIRWGQNKRDEWRKKAEQEMILGMEEAKVKHEIQQLTDEIEHG
jgi:hypothetical protein